MIQRYFLTVADSIIDYPMMKPLLRCISCAIALISTLPIAFVLDLYIIMPS